MSDRFRDALKNAWRKIEEQEWIYGTLGRKKSDGTFTFVVPGRPTFVFVTIRNATGAQTVVPARNDAGVPHSPRLPVRMKLEHGNYVIYAKSGAQGLANLPAQDPYGLVQHSTSHKHGGTDEVGTATPGANAIIKADADGKIGAGWLDPADVGDVGASINAAATDIPLDADKFVFWDVVDTVVKSITWANIKATLKTYFDTLYNLYVHPNHTGDVTSVGDGATTIADDAVTNAKAANMAVNTIKGRITAGTGDPEDLTATNVRTIINVASGADVTGTAITALATKTTPVDADAVVITDSAASDAPKRTTWADIKATLKTYFDTLYVALTGAQTIAGIKTFSDNLIAKHFRGQYSGAVDFAFYSGSNVEVLANAYWDGTNYKRFVSGKASKVVTTSDGRFRVQTTDTSLGADVNITDFLTRFEITAAGIAAIGGVTPNVSTVLDVGGAARVRRFFYMSRDADALTNYLFMVSRGAAEASSYGSPLGNGAGEISADGLAGLILGTRDATPLVFGTNNVERMRILSSGFMGIGTASPQGKLHIHDGTSGRLFVSKSLPDGTAVILVPDGTGDITALLLLTTIIKPSSGASTTFSASLVPGGSTNIYNNGSGDIVAMSVAANGSVSVQRTGGSLTYTIFFDLRWQ